ncbi:MAG: small multi-drug export protein [Candidatus Poseidoniaceae archaeon]|nr:small multi-drug export protein [Candidatus Poseidoniaceae archaeon]
MGEELEQSDEPIEEVDVEQKARDKITRELEEIRRRKTKTSKRRFLSNKEDYILFAGIGYGIFFAVLLFGMSSGIFGSSTTLDYKASETFLDTGEECQNIEDQPWVHMFPENDAEYFDLSGRNLPEGYAYMNYTILNYVGESWLENSTDDTIVQVSGGKSEFRAPFDELDVGEYRIILLVQVYNQSDDLVNASLIEGAESLSKEIDFELEVKGGGFFSFLPFVDSESHREVTISDPGPRTCWTTKDLGEWGYLLMAAELGGGRETAMLTGGTAGIPAWWMAFISLSLSAVTLLVIYPVMYKIYHQETDDILSRTHISRVVEDILGKTSKRLHIDIDWELYKLESRELSIDIMVPYKNTDGTLSDSKDIRAEILREVLEEFAIFRVFKPVQLTVKTIGINQAIDFESGVGIGAGAEGADTEEEQDYASFFSELHTLSRVEDEVRDSLDLFFARRTDVRMEGAVVTSDDKVIFVSVIYKPTQRFAFFRFKKTTDEVEVELYRYISDRNEDLLGSQELIVKARNQVSTLSDRSGAGRVESGGKNDDRIVAVAKQDGLGGKMLQTNFIGNTLSTVEYMANEKREMINKWGFWGLIVFVWIPFMASGVLVGAMLGLLSRMKFTRVLAATFIGGAAASITWAYTAEGIVKFMHQYKLEAVIPLIIIVFVGAAFLHIRSTKVRRQTELFEDTLLDNFHADVAAKYGEH